MAEGKQSPKVIPVRSAGATLGWPREQNLTHPMYYGACRVVFKAYTSRGEGVHGRRPAGWSPSPVTAADHVLTQLLHSRGVLSGHTDTMPSFARPRCFGSHERHEESVRRPPFRFEPLLSHQRPKSRRQLSSCGAFFRGVKGQQLAVRKPWAGGESVKG